MLTQTFVINHKCYIKEGSRPWKRRVGYVIRGMNGKWWALNWYRGRPYLSNLHHVEIFQKEETAIKWMSRYGIFGKVVSLMVVANPSEEFRYLFSRRSPMTPGF